MQKHVGTILVVALLLAGVGRAGFLAWQTYEKNLQKDFDDKIALLQKQISALGEQIAKFSNQSPEAALPQTEVVNREIIREKSQDQLLTEAVAKIAPSVVSVVIAKYVPQLEVVYGNPFGDDPFFKDFDFRVPMYRQKGVEKQKVGAGTGFFITTSGYILTNRHVVEDTEAEYTVLLASGQQKSARVVYKDPSLDVAVIKIDGQNYPAAELGDSQVLKLGQTVMAIGNALGEYNNSVSTGIISGLDRTVEAANSQGRLETLSGVIQTDAAINPGNSGGPLLTLEGKVIGINVATVIGSNSISFAIPINKVKFIISNVVPK